MRMDLELIKIGNCGVECKLNFVVISTSTTCAVNFIDK